MLKRTQVLLEDWQVEHYKSTAAKYDVSFSEMIRMALCLDIITATRMAFPKYKFKFDVNKLENVVKKQKIVQAMGIEQFHSFLSKLYFETRKATDLWKAANHNSARDV
jgi:hypothetical protein